MAILKPGARRKTHGENSLRFVAKAG